MHNWPGILSSLFFALFLSLLPMPEWVAWIKPAWVLMTLIYWSMMVPTRIGIGFAWTTGLIVDLVQGSLLGEHALAYMIVIYFVSRIHIRLRIYPQIQQSFMICMFVLIYQFIIFCVQGFIGELPNSHLYWLSPLTSMLFWPWIYLLLRSYGRWLRIS